MSRVANSPVLIPKGIEVVIAGGKLTAKGSKLEGSVAIHKEVSVAVKDKMIVFSANNKSKSADALAGTHRALVNNLVKGISVGFEKKLQLVGVGYRAESKGNKLDLVLGFSHPIEFAIPDGISIETPSPTEIVVKGSDKRIVGQVAALIRDYRPPEPYKGKGVRYANEEVVRKEAKKK